MTAVLLEFNPTKAAGLIALKALEDFAENPNKGIRTLSAMGLTNSMWMMGWCCSESREESWFDYEGSDRPGNYDREQIMTALAMIVALGEDA